MIFEVKDYLTMQKAIESLCVFLMEEGAQENSVFDSKLVAYEFREPQTPWQDILKF